MRKNITPYHWLIAIINTQDRTTSSRSSNFLLIVSLGSRNLRRSHDRDVQIMTSYDLQLVESIQHFWLHSLYVWDFGEISDRQPGPHLGQSQRLEPFLEQTFILKDKYLKSRQNQSTLMVLKGLYGSEWVRGLPFGQTQTTGGLIP